MVVKAPQEAVDNANRYTTCEPGKCLSYVRGWLEIPPQDGDAATAWRNALGKHPSDSSPPQGAPRFWLGGSSGYGHIALEVHAANRRMRGTDMPYAGQVSTQDDNWIDQHWSSMTYAGWAEGFNGVWIPYLKNWDQKESKWSKGDVYVAKLHAHQKNSDSVSRLCWRLRNHNDMPGSHKPPKQVANYTEEIVEAVRYWQRNIAAKDVPGPQDGKKLSNKQANRLFTDDYHVIEKK